MLFQAINPARRKSRPPFELQHFLYYIRPVPTPCSGHNSVAHSNNNAIMFFFSRKDPASGKMYDREELTSELRDAWESMIIRDIATAGGVDPRQVECTEGDAGTTKLETWCGIIQSFHVRHVHPSIACEQVTQITKIGSENRIIISLERSQC